MAIHETIQAIANKHQVSGFIQHPPANPEEIKAFEMQIGFSLPQDFAEFYSICNGFSCNEDLFNMTCLADILIMEDYGIKWFYFSEYMIHSDCWGLRQVSGPSYQIYNGSYQAATLTSSLDAFLLRYLRGDVFDHGGLYDWHKERNISSPDWDHL
jgi:hypothetical protein